MCYDLWLRENEEKLKVRLNTFSYSFSYVSPEKLSLNRIVITCYKLILEGV